MEKDMITMVRELIALHAEDTAFNAWIEDSYNLRVFSGWIGECANLSDEEGMNDAWKEYDKEDALEYFCKCLMDIGAIADWDWDYGHQNVIIRRIGE